MSAILTKLLAEMTPYLAPMVAALVIKELAVGANWLRKKLQASRKTALLAAGVDAAEDALDAGLTAAGANAGKGVKPAAEAALAAGKGAVIADKGVLVDAAKAELDVLTSPPAPTTATTPGGAVVNLPPSK